MLVRPASIIAIGNCDDRPDYDYTDGTQLLFSYFEDEDSAEIFLPDLRGEKKGEITAKCHGSMIEVAIKGGSNISCRSLDESKSVHVTVV